MPDDVPLLNPRVFGLMSVLCVVVGLMIGYEFYISFHVYHLTLVQILKISAILITVGVVTGITPHIYLHFKRSNKSLKQYLVDIVEPGSEE